MGGKKQMPEKVLPNGTIISYLPNVNGDWEIPSTFNHVQQYFKYGIEVKEGSVVLDIGANIGLFALEVYNRCKGNVFIHSFEPIPKIFKALEQNLKRWDKEKLKAHNFGISNKSGNISFTYYPGAPGLSTHHPEFMKVGLDNMLQNIDDNTEKLPEFFTSSNDREITVNKERFNKMRAVLGLKKVFEERILECDVKTLGDFLSDAKIEEIDLLKVDVNGSEWDVFSSIDKKDWNKIRQVVTEVPLGGETLSNIKEVLYKNNFNSIQVEEQEAAINKGLSYFIIYAQK